MAKFTAKFMARGRAVALNEDYRRDGGAALSKRNVKLSKGCD